MTTNNSRALHMAHILHKHKPDFQWGDMLRYGWYFVRFRQALQQGLVKFSYFKKDGSIREARGTLCMDLIPDEKWPKGTKSSLVNWSIVNYFDLAKGEWRSFAITEFIGYVEVLRLSEELWLQKKGHKRKVAKEK